MEKRILQSVEIKESEKMSKNKTVQVAPDAKKKRSVSYLPEDAQVWDPAKGWVFVKDISVIAKAGKRIQAREMFTRAVVSLLLKKGPQSRVTFTTLAKEIGLEAKLKTKVGYGFLFKEGVVGRIPGKLVYGLTRKAEKEYPELFKQALAAVPKTAPIAPTVEAEESDSEAEDLEGKLE